jgi:hypothetical protein
MLAYRGRVRAHFGRHYDKPGMVQRNLFFESVKREYGGLPQYGFGD